MANNKLLKKFERNQIGPSNCLLLKRMGYKDNIFRAVSTAAAGQLVVAVSQFQLPTFSRLP